MKIKDFLYTIKKYVTCPWKIVVDICHYDNYQYAKLFSDKLYLKCLFHVYMNKSLDLKNPKTFNEKLQWLKLYNRNKDYSNLVDKYEVKKYIEEKIGAEYVIKNYGVWDKYEDIDFESLPDKFVLKCTHDSGSVVICTDKSNFDKGSAKEKLNKYMAKNHFWRGREWPYKSLTPRIIAEEYMIDEKVHELRDYKFFCFDGKADCVMICLDRNIHDEKFYFFDKNWNLKRLNKRGKEASEDFSVEKPEKIDEMFQISEKLSEGIPFVRVDLYECNGKIYFGELTFFSSSGCDPNLLKETDEYFGSLIKLNK